MDGMGTDDETLIRVLTARRHRLHGINDKFMAKCGLVSCIVCGFPARVFLAVVS